MIRAGQAWGWVLGLLAWGAVAPGPEAAAQGIEGYPHGTFSEGLGCLDCHTTEGWKPIQEDPVFDHGKDAGFLLLGQHASASCRSCHEDLHFEKAQASPQECGNCHMDVHSGSLSSNCSLCHTPNSFKDVSGLQIHQATGFPLDGAHLQLSCESCHTDDEGGAYSPLPTDCLACHEEDFGSPKEVDHVALDFPGECLTCHTPQSWLDIGTFDHAEFSGGYQLRGAHQAAQCSACHIQGGGLRFQPVDDQDCVACHQADYQREHAGSGYPTTCLLCHGQGTWDTEDFDHAEVSGGYSLVGAHEALACTNCHTPDGNGTLFTPISTDDCVACHSADFQREHAGSGYPTECTTCHVTNTWDGATVDHSALSGGFGLLGDHSILPCTSCHVPGGTETLFDPATPEDCVACHQTDYQQQHTGSGYPTTCLTCHTINTWGGAVVDHAVVSGGFALPSDHEALACTNCHTPDGNGTLFTPTSNDDCVACHSADFQREHAGSGYPTECTTCHVTNTWDGATVDHSALSGGFGLVGNHNLLDCASCHILPDMTPIFTPTNPEDCLACHLGDFQREHTGSGFPTSCLSCHVVTTWGGAHFNHDADCFPVYSGKHQGKWTSCQTCHSNPDDYTIFSCLNCHEHNKTDTDRDHSEVQGYAYVSGQCLSCHPTGKS